LVEWRPCRIGQKESITIMDSTTTTRTRDGNTLLGLISGLREDVRDLFHEEVQLAKTEVAEKVSHFGRNSVYLAIGGAVLYLSVIFLLLALGFVASFALEAAGLSTGMSLFLGFLAVAVVAGIVGGILVAKSLKAMKKESLVPQKTIETLKEIKEGGLEQTRVPIRSVYSTSSEPEDRRTSDQIRSDLERTRGRIGEEVRGIKTRLRVATAATVAVDRLRRNPVRALSLGVGTGLVGFILMRASRWMRKPKSHRISGCGCH
jgi:hypothetical protein